MATNEHQTQPNDFSIQGIIMVQKVYQGIGHFENAEQFKSTLRDVWDELDEEWSVIAFYARNNVLELS